MTEGYGYDPYGQQQPQILGYDDYGQPIYQQPGQDYPPYDPYQQAQPGQQQPQQQPQQPYDPYATDSGQQPPVQDPYGYPAPDQYQAPHTYPGPDQYQQQPPYPDAYGGGQTGQQPPQQGGYGYDPYGPAADTGQPYSAYDPYGAATDTGARVPRQAPPPAAEQQQPYPDQGEPEPQAEHEPGTSYETEQFSFVEEKADDSEDVIDWLKFTESRTERREEAKRRGRTRKSMLIVLLVLVLAGGTGYLWSAGKLPGVGDDSGTEEQAAGAKRDVLVVHLRSTENDDSSTALLVDNATAKQGTTLLLPNTLALASPDGGTTTLGKAVESEGAAPTRDALNTLFGADIKGTWRLDTPYLEILVDSVGGIAVDTDASVPGPKKGDDPLVRPGKGQTLDGQAAVAYATHRADGEAAPKQLARFGQVMQAVLKKVSSDKGAATSTVKSLGQIQDPSLSEESLGATLAQLAELAKDGAHQTRLLPVQANGTLSAKTSDGMVKDVLGGTVQNSDPDATPQVRVQDASGTKGANAMAQAALVNGGYAVVDGGRGDEAQARSRVSYAEESQKKQAVEVAKTLGLPASAVRQGKAAGNADVAVVLGRDYKP